MAYFQDIRSKAVLEFKSEHDIKGMKTHPDYKEVDEKAFKDYQTSFAASVARAKKAAQDAE